jgi:LacI family transcriptional regulator
MTVSRVVRSERGVRTAVRDRVLSAIQATGYRPCRAAQATRSGVSSLFALISWDYPKADFNLQLELGATRQCRETGHHLILETVGPTDDVGAVIDELAGTMQLAGFILNPPVCDHRGALETLLRLGTPFVRIHPQPDGLEAPAVTIDDFGAARDMTKMLVDLGHERIAFIRGPPGFGSSRSRWEGYAKVMQQHGLRPDVHTVSISEAEEGRLTDIVRPVLERAALPSAIFAHNDDIAISAVAVARSMGIKVPEELSIAGFDDVPAGRMISPKLTTVHQPIEEIGNRAVELLHHFCSHTNETPAELTLILKHHLVIRDSTTALPK